jgi:hypothetical protein
MKLLIASSIGVLMLGGCAAEKTSEVPVAATAPTTTNTAPTTATPAVAPTSSEATTDAAAQTSTQTSTSENQDSGTWAGQIKVAQPVSMFNYVGAESGDFAPMRFRNDSEAGKKILAVCKDDDLCEFTGLVEWLDEPPPPDASAIGQIVRVDRVKRLRAETR